MFFLKKRDPSIDYCKNEFGGEVYKIIATLPATTWEAIDCFIDMQNEVSLKYKGITIEPALYGWLLVAGLVKVRKRVRSGGDLRRRSGLSYWEPNVEIKVDVQGLDATKQHLSNLEKQIPFATALALTRTAKEVQREEIGRIRTAFTVRGSWLREGGKFGVGIVPASKENLVAVVESRAPWLEAHEEGTTRTPEGSHFAIPQKDIRRTKTQVIAKSQRPKALTGQPPRQDLIPNVG